MNYRFYINEAKGELRRPSFTHRIFSVFVVVQFMRDQFSLSNNVIIIIDSYYIRKQEKSNNQKDIVIVLIREIGFVDGRSKDRR